jgi:hypothetical protein
MYSIFDFRFWIYEIIIAIAVFISFYLPGRYLLKKYLPISLQLFVLSNIVGLVFIGYLGYIVGYLHLRWIVFLYVAIFILLFLRDKKQIKKELLKIKQLFFTLPKKVLFLFAIGVILQCIPVIGSGLRYKDGIHFYGVNAHDGIAHLGYMQSIIKHFPPQEPGAFPHLLTNYHYWSDLIFAELARVWYVPLPQLFFQFLPLYISFLTAVTVYIFMVTLSGSTTIAVWALFFLFFGGDAAYGFMLLLHRTFGFYTAAIDNGATQLLNMPHSLAKLVFFGALIFFEYWIKTHKKFYIAVTIFLFSALFGIKIYFGIFVTVGLISLCLALVGKTFIQTKGKTVKKIAKAYKMHKTILVSLLLLILTSLVIYLPANKQAGGLLFLPLGWVDQLLGKGNINFWQWSAARKTAGASGNSVYLYFLDSIGIIITLISIYGTRLIGFIFNRKLIAFLGFEKTFFLIPPLILFQFLGLYTLQVSGTFNVFNFFAVSASVLTIFSAVYVSKMSETSNNLKKIFIVVLVLLTIPRVLFETKSYVNRYIKNTDSYLISNDELDALTFLQKKAPKDALVQAHPNNYIEKMTPYVPYFSNHYAFLSGIDVQETHNQPIAERKKILTEIFNAPNSGDFASKLKEHNIRYVYLLKTPDQTLPFKPTEGHFNYVFRNKSVLIISPAL